MNREWLYLASSPVPSQAANSVHVVHMCDAFSQRGIRLRILSPCPAISCGTRISLQDEYLLRHAPSITNVWKPRVRGGGIIYRSLMSAFLRLSKTDIVYGRSLQGNRIASQMSLPTVFEIHKPEWELSSLHRRNFESLIKGNGFQAIVCISRALEKHLLDRYPGLGGRTIVAHDGAPTLPATRIVPGSKKFTVGYFGSLHRGKGVETLLTTAPLCPWAEFRIVGGDADSIVSWSDAQIIPSNVIFLGHQSYRKAIELMADCHVLVAPYLEEVSVHGGGGDVARWMSPLKIFEYMAMGRPIVSADLPVLREILNDGENALLAKPGDGEAWAQVLLKLRNSPQLARQLGTRARAAYETNCTWDARAERIISKLQRMGIVSAGIQ